MKASVICPVWNRGDLTHQFLAQHWMRAKHHGDVEIIIIDNGSMDHTGRLLDQWQRRFGDQLVVLSNSDNRGFGPANNQGAAKARGDYLVFLSNDVLVNGDYLTPLLEALENKPGSLVGACLYDWDTGWNRFASGIIPYLGGWCVAMHKDIFNHLGGWDEIYFPADYEDVDLSYAASQEGIELVAVSLPLVHLSGQTATQLPDREAMTKKHRQMFMQKWGLKDAIKA